jgi:hypothetical protein
VQAVAVAVIGHRLRPVGAGGEPRAQLVQRLIESVPIP